MTLKFDWLRQYPEEIRNIDKIPLLGLFPFPWQKLSETLAKTFECGDFEILPSEITWRTQEDLLSDLAQPFTILTFTIPALKGEACWLMSTEEVNLLECLLLTNETNPLTIQDQEFQTSFLRFLTLETLNAISHVIPDRSLMPVLTEKTDLPKETSLCMDISIKICKRFLSGRLIISPLLRHSLSGYSQKNSSGYPSKQALNIIVPINVEIGQTLLTTNEWKQVSVGDFITLDRCSIDPKELTGEVTLCAFGQQAFRGELQGTQIKIIEFPEFPVFQEEETNMAKDLNNEDEDELSDLGFDDEDDDFDELDEDLFKDFEVDDDDEATDSLEDRDDEISSEQKEEKPIEKDLNEHLDAVEETSIVEKSEKLPEPPSQGLLKPEQVPIAIVVELGKIQMTMDKLLQIEPGNLLDISLQPENGVSLTFNGKMIAKAELIRIGESLGVRILDLG